MLTTIPVAVPPSCKIEFAPIVAEPFKFPERLSVPPPEIDTAPVNIAFDGIAARARYGNNEGSRPYADITVAAAAYCDFVCSSSGVDEIAAVPTADGINVTRTAVC